MKHRPKPTVSWSFPFASSISEKCRTALFVIFVAIECDRPYFAFHYKTQRSLQHIYVPSCANDVTLMCPTSDISFQVYTSYLKNCSPLGSAESDSAVSAGRSSLQSMVLWHSPEHDNSRHLLYLEVNYLYHLPNGASGFEVRRAAAADLQRKQQNLLGMLRWCQHSSKHRCSYILEYTQAYRRLMSPWRWGPLWEQTGYMPADREMGYTIWPSAVVSILILTGRLTQAKISGIGF